MTSLVPYSFNMKKYIPPRIARLITKQKFQSRYFSSLLYIKTSVEHIFALIYGKINLNIMSINRNNNYNNNNVFLTCYKLFTETSHQFLSLLFVYIFYDYVMSPTHVIFVQVFEWVVVNSFSPSQKRTSVSVAIFLNRFEKETKRIWHFHDFNLPFGN